LGLVFGLGFEGAWLGFEGAHGGLGWPLAIFGLGPGPGTGELMMPKKRLGKSTPGDSFFKSHVPRAPGGHYNNPL
jgi:hypothetical protein